MRVALIHDYLNQYGGAERVLEAFCEVWPEAPIYTLIYDEKRTGHAFAKRKIYTSFLQRLPLVKAHHRPFLWLMPIAIEQFDLSDYDVVISDSASYAKGVIVKPKTLHVCYCHTPTRYAWDDSHKYIQEFGYASLIKRIIPFFMNYLRIWDEAAAHRVDRFIANSHFVAARIRKYYQRESEVIYPPVKTNFFLPQTQTSDYFLIVSRFLPYKRLSLAILAFNQLGLPLKIIGDGPEREKLEDLAGENIEFIGLVSDEILKKYYAECRAFVFPQEEDFGISAVEAMAAGKPVIAYQAGGALEILQDNQTGIFFKEQTVESLIKAVQIFQTKKFDSSFIRQSALRFDKEMFKNKIRKFVNQTWREFQNHARY